MSYFKFPATLTQGNGPATVTAYNEAAVGQSIFSADSNHPHWNSIIDGLIKGDDSVWDLFDVAAGVMTRFQKVTDRVSWNGSEVLWDGDPVHTALSEHLSRAIEDGNADNYTAIAKFWEKLESNPDEHSRTQAYDWLACHKFQITPDGDVVGYKGVSKSYNSVDGVDVFHSMWGSAVPGKPSGFVNGVAIAELSKVPQSIGDEVTMPRSEVAHDPSQACKRGLHVATRAYASGYGNTVLEVHVNPRDIVSVPTDAHGAKVRVCRYTVARVALDEGAYNGPVLRESAENVWTGDVGYRV